MISYFELSTFTLRFAPRFLLGPLKTLSDSPHPSVPLPQTFLIELLWVFLKTLPSDVRHAAAMCAFYSRASSLFDHFYYILTESLQLGKFRLWWWTSRTQREKVHNHIYTEHHWQQSMDTLTHINVLCEKSERFYLTLIDHGRTLVVIELWRFMQSFTTNMCYWHTFWQNNSLMATYWYSKSMNIHIFINYIYNNMCKAEWLWC